MPFIVILIIVLIIILAAAEWSIFSKAGKPGWFALIPVFNTLVLLEIINKPWWWIFLFLIPALNIIFIIWSLNILSKCFGKNEAFTAGLFLLPIVFIPLLGFGNATYENPVLQEDDE